MRLWTLHPCYLDQKGLVALWREALLAQAVLSGRTRGYTHHPQLIRFRETGSASTAIAEYLRAVHAEATRRGYRFDDSKIAPVHWDGRMCVTDGQLTYEWSHLVRKLEHRDTEWLDQIGTPAPISAHPLFEIVAGPVESWEVSASEH